jgi:hypothetical protein
MRRSARSRSSEGNSDVRPGTSVHVRLLGAWILWCRDAVEQKAHPALHGETIQSVPKGSRIDYAGLGSSHRRRRVRSRVASGPATDTRFSGEGIRLGTRVPGIRLHRCDSMLAARCRHARDVRAGTAPSIEAPGAGDCDHLHHSSRRRNSAPATHARRGNRVSVQAVQRTAAARSARCSSAAQ